MSSPVCISVRGARQHNLKNVNVDVPLHRLTVITGLSGSGKSSLAFDTLYAEGQRRYVETFSPYTRQFLERMDKPDVDRIDGIPPAIAIEQSNQVKSSRSTVGTMTEIADHLKMLFAHAARLTCPHCGREVRPWSGNEISAHLIATLPEGQEVLIGFSVAFPNKPSLASAFAALKSQGFVRAWIDGAFVRTDTEPGAKEKAPAMLLVVQDRIKIREADHARLDEAVEQAMRHGQGVVRILPLGVEKPAELRFAKTWYCPYDDVTFKEPTPALFSFNNPVGACPTCRGFGRTIEIDHERALPDRRLSIAQGVVKPWQTPNGAESQRDLLKHCRERNIPINVPFHELSADHQKFLIDGEVTPDNTLDELWQSGGWYGVKGFFQWLETKTYKMHVRIFLARYRSYMTCPTCQGARFRPEPLQYFVEARDKRRLNIAKVNALALLDARVFVEALKLPAGDEGCAQLQREILTRIDFLLEVGLGYLTLDRTTRTLSGGEIERVNLTSCLGNSLVNTLFVLDEPSIGLHPRDTDRLGGIITRLRDRGNTVVVVEHDAALMKKADHLLELGPGRGELGGNIIFEGPFDAMLADKESTTGAFLSGRRRIPLPAQRRPRKPGHEVRIEGATAHNLEKLDATIPLGMFVVVTGVSGSGKSTLVHEVLYGQLAKARQQAVDEQAGNVVLERISGADLVGSVVRIDQSPLARTPRSNPALYLGVYALIRQIFGGCEEAISRGIAPGDFSFNGGTGRCPRCNGTGFEKIEMQFLSDVFVTCPVCEGKRFQPHVLEVVYQGATICDVLAMTVDEAITFFDPARGEGTTSSRRHAEIAKTLQGVSEVGLGYLRLGQPLSQLSGGEAQRIKILSCLHGSGVKGEAEEDEEKPTSKPAKKTGKAVAEAEVKDAPGGRLFILDEPTTGLHFEDIRLLVLVLQRLVDQGDSIIVIEHNLDVIKSADWVIDLGPEAGAGGGLIVAEGTPETVAQVKASHTGRYLAQTLQEANAPLPGAGKNGRVRYADETALPIALLAERAPRTAARGLALPQTSGLISIRGARHHNLQNLSLDIALNEMTVITGLSGSGKSTLAFDLLFAEGQRRYLDSLNAYARQFVEQLEKPEVDSITGIPPAVAIEQRVTRGGRKSTVATVTEIYQFLRLLMAKLGDAYDPETGERTIRQTSAQIIPQLEAARAGKEMRLFAPIVRGRKGFHTDVAKWAVKKGYAMMRVDGKMIASDLFQALDRYKEHTIDVQVATLSEEQKPAERRRLTELALQTGRGTIYALDTKGKQKLYSTNLYCPGTGRSFEDLDPRHFSFHSPHGWCPTCQGYGTVVKVSTQGETELERELETERAREDAENEGAEPTLCPTCQGARVNALARAVRLPMGVRAKIDGGPTLPEITSQTIHQARDFFSKLALIGRSAAIARDILPEIVQRLLFLEEVGLGYLTLDRSAATLSGGEAQRIRLAAQLGSNLQGVLYVLDEPTIGLHPRDNERLLKSLRTLQQKGNTLVIVEHDEDTMRKADHIIDLGPGAGTRGGRIVAQGSWEEISRNSESVTGQLLGEPLRHPLHGTRRPITARGVQWLIVRGAKANNLRGITAAIPLGRLTTICGVSGAGKSTLVHEVLRPGIALAREEIVAARKREIAGLRKSRKGRPDPRWESFEGAEWLSSVYEVDQSPIGKTSRSTPATYIGLMDHLRTLFAQLPLSRQRGYDAGRFSFNSGSGRCEVCQGNGATKVEMNFLPPVLITCEGCGGKRYNRETLEATYNGKNLAEVLCMTVEEAAEFFAAVPRLARPLQLLAETGLGYLTLGQRSPTLSGGEAQRIKLVAELARSLESNTQKRLGTRGFANLQHIYFLEEPTIGLHLADVRRLLNVMNQLVDAGHTVVVIEHHLDVIAESDHVIEMGPEGGENGGRVIALGTPEEVAEVKGSPTAPFLKTALESAKQKTAAPAKAETGPRRKGPVTK